MLVKEIMTSPVHTISPTTSLLEIHKLFKHISYHHLLVVENEALMGVMSDKDVIRMVNALYDKGNQTFTAADFMSTDLVTIEEDAEMDVASILLLENNISCLPVVSNLTTIKGILTWKDLLKFYVYSK